MTQEYLTQPRDVRPHALLKALEEYEQAHLGTESDVQDAFSAMALRCLTFEPLANPPLHPEAWRVVRPRLELSVRLTSEGTLDFQASPWPEKTQRIGAIRWQMEDFVAFPQENGQTKFPQVSLLSLDLEDLRFELRDPDLAVTEAATFRRRLLFACYEFVISRLAVHFECRIRTALFCFGTHSKLMIRDVAHQGDYLQSTDLKSEPERFEWHSRYLALCKTNGVGPAELLAFYEKFIADLPEHERSTTFRQFLGEGRHLSKGTDELLPILGVLTHPHQIPPLINHPSNDVESFLKQQTAQAEFDAMDSIAAVYCLERSEMFELMAAHYPSVLVAYYHLDDQALSAVPAIEPHGIQRFHVGQ